MTAIIHYIEREKERDRYRYRYKDIQILRE